MTAPPLERWRDVLATDTGTHGWTDLTTLVDQLDRWAAWHADHGHVTVAVTLYEARDRVAEAADHPSVIAMQTVSTPSRSSLSVVR